MDVIDLRGLESITGTQDRLGFQLALRLCFGCEQRAEDMHKHKQYVHDFFHEGLPQKHDDWTTVSNLSTDHTKDTFASSSILASPKTTYIHHAKNKKGQAHFFFAAFICCSCYLLFLFSCMHSTFKSL